MAKYTKLPIVKKATSGLTSKLCTKGSSQSQWDKAKGWPETGVNSPLMQLTAAHQAHQAHQMHRQMHRQTCGNMLCRVAPSNVLARIWNLQLIAVELADIHICDGRPWCAKKSKSTWASPGPGMTSENVNLQILSERHAGDYALAIMLSQHVEEGLHVRTLLTWKSRTPWLRTKQQKEQHRDEPPNRRTATDHTLIATSNVLQASDWRPSKWHSNLRGSCFQVAKCPLNTDRWAGLTCVGGMQVKKGKAWAVGAWSAHGFHAHRA